MGDTSRARAIPENVVVVGVDGTERDREVVGWAARSALRPRSRWTAISGLTTCG